MLRHKLTYWNVLYETKNKISCHVSDGRFFVAEIFLIDCYLKPVSVKKAQSFQYLTELLCALVFIS